MENQKKELINTLRLESSSLKNNIGLYDTMVLKPQMMSRSVEEIDKMIEFRNGLQNTLDHVDHKLVSCLGCEKILTCSSKC